MNPRPTLADVARASGMSVTSVSLVLNDAPGARISKDSAERIRRAAAELGYRPNRAARSLRVGTTQTIGFMSHEITLARYATEMIRGVLDVAHRAEHTVLITEFGHDEARRDSSVRALLDQRPDGLIYGEMGAKHVDLPPRLRAAVPVVLANARADGDLTCVLPAEFDAGVEVARTLLEAGHRRIVILGENPRFRSDPRVSATIDDRFRGIESVLASAGLSPAARLFTEDWEPEFGYRAMAEFLRSDVEFTGVIAMNDRVAFGAYEAARAAGVNIPEDFSMVSFDDDVLASYVHPGLTTARIPYLDIGRTTMEMLLAGRTHEGVVRIPMPLQVRGSVAAPR